MADEAASTETLTETVAASEVAPETALGAATTEVATEAVVADASADPAVVADPAAAATDADASTDADAAKGEVPETYELTAPEGIILDPALIEAATPIFKDMGLSNDQANKLMPIAAQMAQRIGDNLNQQILDSVATERANWLNTAKNDPEIGGQNWDANLVTAAKGLDTLGFVKGSPLRNLLDESGLGNHPEMIRAFVKVGKAIGEDGFERGAGSAAIIRDKAEILYPNDKAKGN